MADKESESGAGKFPTDETLQLLGAGMQVFGRYRLVRVIGRGGMGVVWLATDEILKLDVALKFLPDSVGQDKEAIADLLRETRRSLALTHANIVRVYDFFHDESRAAIAMEYVDGSTLSALKVERPDMFFEVDEIAPWVRQLCGALQYAHTEAKVVHQDLKPSNLMLTSKGQLKVADFGIARSIRESVTRITADQRMGGTLLYMGPQQMDGERPSHLNDIYSLGATLYDLLTSKPPFYSGALYEQIARKPAPKMAERRAELDHRGKQIPPHWEETIAACLAKEPEKRPQSATEVAQRLKLGNGAEHLAGFTPPAGRPAKRGASPFLWTLVAAVAAGGLLLTAFYGGWLGRARPAQGSSDEVATHSKPPAPSSPDIEFAPGRALVLPSVFKGLPEREPWVNSLGMKFLPVAGLGVSIWETRVQDFAEFAKETHYDASQGVLVQGRDGFVNGGSWDKPVFPQNSNYPVCGMSWTDGMAFCRWLTEKERKAGLLNAHQSYRLPFLKEWAEAAGPGKYTWGDGWPPPEGAGNFAGTEVRDDGNWPPDRAVIEGYHDGFARTAPVGTFLPNPNGLFDMSGNVWEWCMDSADGRKRSLAGGSWHNYQPANFENSSRGAAVDPKARDLGYGFRCVLEETAAR